MRQQALRHRRVLLSPLILNRVNISLTIYAGALRGQGTAIDRTGLCGRRLQRRVWDRLSRFGFPDGLLDLFDRQAQLIRMKFFGFAAELRATQLAQNIPQSGISILDTGEFGVFFSGRFRPSQPLGDDQRL